jgi:Ca-activated chloride channel family protein
LARKKQLNIRKMKRSILIFIALLINNSLFAQDPQKLLRSGNKAYYAGKFKEAEIDYRKSFEKNKEYYKGMFNLGNALYKQNNYSESANIYDLLTQNNAIDNTTKSKVFHNLGNSKLQEKKYEESINAYKNALKLNPKDQETKYNLAYAQKKLQQQQQQQDKENKDNKQNKDQQQQQQENQDKKDEQKQQQQQKNEISKEDAEKMLNALNNQEKDLQDNKKKDSIKVVNAGLLKDW